MRGSKFVMKDQTVAYMSILVQTVSSGKIQWFRADDSRFVSEDEVECKTCQCKGNACSSQYGERDSEGKIY